MELLRGFQTLPRISLPLGGRDDDVFADRLNYKYTSFILIISSFIITYKILQYDHIQCWVPAILARYEQYINVYCWISNTYYVTFKEQTTSLTNKHERMVKYYQWVPLILLTLAFAFVLPRSIYRFLSKQSGIDMLNVADAAVNYMSVEKFDKKRKILLYLSNTIHFYSSCNRAKRARKGFANSGSFLGSSSASASSSNMISNSSSKPHMYDLIFCYGRMNGSYLIVLYLITKLFYIANVVAQLFLLNVLLGFNYNSQGLQMLKDIAKTVLYTNDKPVFNGNFNNFNNPNGYTPSTFSPNLPLQQQQSFSTNNQEPFGTSLYTESVSPLSIDGKTSDRSIASLIHRYFPRESACDFRIRMNVDSMVHNYTVQCVLPINLFNEQLFTLLWVWLWFILVVNVYDLVCWVFRLIPSSRYNYVRNRIRLKHSENTVKRQLNSFVFDYLSCDGIFLLRILSQNKSDTVTHDIVQFLWNNYVDGRKSGGGGSGGGSGDAKSTHASRIQQRFAARPNQNGDKNDANNDAQESRYSTNYINVDNI